MLASLVLLIGCQEPTAPPIQAAQPKWWYCTAYNPRPSSESERQIGHLTSFTRCFRAPRQCEDRSFGGNCAVMTAAWCPIAGDDDACMFAQDWCEIGGVRCRLTAP